MELQKGRAYDVVVTKILQRGIIVQISGSGETEFIHISKLSNRYVSDISQVVNVGSAYTAIGVYDTVKDRVGLSLKHIDRAERSDSNKEVYVRKDRTIQSSYHKSLDDMIAEADNSLHEKQRAMGQNLHTKQRRRHRNNHREKRDDY